MNLGSICKKFAIGSALWLVAGCATVLSGTTQAINIQAVDSANNAVLEGAQCTVTDGSGATYHVPTNPGEVIISKKRGNIVVSCVKKGYTQINTGVGESFNGVTFVNVLFWPGFIVDALTGAYKDLPSHYVAVMRKNEHAR